MTTQILCQNFLTDASMLTASSQAPYKLGGIEIAKVGSANIRQLRTSGGDYDGDDAIYRFQIDSVGHPDGPFIGSTWRWSDTGGVAWNVTDIALQPLVWVALNHNLEVQFVPGLSLPQVVVGDYWQISVFRPYGVKYLLDGSRMQGFRSGPLGSGAVFTLAMDLGSAQTPTHLMVADHTFPAGSTVRMQGDDASAFTSLNHNEVVPWTSGQLQHVLTSPMNLRYWRLHVTLGAAVDDVRMSEVYLGTALTFSQPYRIGYRQRLTSLASPDLETLSRGPAPLGRVPTVYELTFPALQAGADLASVQTLAAASFDETARVQRPFWLLCDDANPPIAALVQFVGDVPFDHRFLDRFDVPWNVVTITRRAA